MSLPAKFHQYLLELRVTNSMQWQRMNRQTKFEQMTRKILTSRTQQTLYISYTLWSILIEFGVFIVVYIPFVGRTGTIQFTKISIENKSTFLVWHKKKWKQNGKRQKKITRLETTNNLKGENNNVSMFKRERGWQLQQKKDWIKSKVCLKPWKYPTRQEHKLQRFIQCSLKKLEAF